LLLLACACARPQPVAVTVPEPSQPAARATLELGVEHVGKVSEGRAWLDAWTARLTAPETLWRASHEAGSRIDEKDVRVDRRCDRGACAESVAGLPDARRSHIELAVTGESRDAATARCLALIRAAESRESELRHGAAEKWLKAERDRLLAELRRIASLQAAVGANVSHALSTPEVERARLQTELRLLQYVEQGAETDDTQPIARELLAVETELVSLSAEGKGELHPKVVAAQALAAFWRRLLAQQVEADRAALRSELDFLDQKGPSENQAKVAWARLSALAARLDPPPATGVMFRTAPLVLRIRAAEQRAVLKEIERSLGRGPGHPSRMGLEAELSELQRRTELDRKTVVATARSLARMLEQRQISPGGALTAMPPSLELESGAERARERLAAVLTELDEAEKRQIPGVRVEVLTPCGSP
jgi:hypothetical protein